MGSDGMDIRAAVGRRAVLAAGGAAAGLGAVAVVSGCGGSTTSAPAATAAPTAAAAGAGSAGTPLGEAADVPVGGGKVFGALEVVVTQPEAGTFRGFSAVCSHTGCIVDKVADGTIDCPCHGSRYRLDGTVAVGPAPRALTSRAVSVINGKIVLS